MGNRTWLYLAEKQTSAEQLIENWDNLVAETNNQFSVSWFALIPESIFNEYLDKIRHLSLHTINEDDDNPNHWQERLISVPLQYAIDTFKDTLLPLIQQHPDLIKVAYPLYQALAERITLHQQPTLFFDFSEMSGFYDSNQDYINALNQQFLFWQSPLTAKKLNLCTNNPHQIHSLAQNQQLKQKNNTLNEMYEQLTLLEQQAYSGPAVIAQQRWQDKHENLVTWILGIISAIAFFIGYWLTKSGWFGAFTFLLVAISTALIVYRRPQRKVKNKVALQQYQTFNKEIAQLAETTPLEPEPLIPNWVHKHKPAMTNHVLKWDDTAIQASLWANNEIITIKWSDIEAIYFETDDGSADAALIWAIDLTEAAENKPQYQLDYPLWFEFDPQLDPLLTVAILQLTHQLMLQSPKS